MDLKRDQLVDGILQLQRSVFMEFHASATPVWVEVDLTIAQIKALFVVETRGPMMVSQAALELGIGKPAASILLDRLVHAGLVGRNEDSVDRRRAIVHVTPQGEELITKLLQGRLERMQDYLMQMSDEDLEALLKGMRALAALVSPGRPVSQRQHWNSGGIE